MCSASWPAAQVNPLPALPPKPYPPTPRLADGTPNLGPGRTEQGLLAPGAVPGLQAGPAPSEGDSLSAVGESAGDAAPGRAVEVDPQGYCMPPSGPRLMTTPFPMEILQLPEQKRIVMIYEGGTHIWRVIYMDGRPHPKAEALNPTWLGHSVGRWEATRWSSTSWATTKAAGSTWLAIRTPIACTWSSVSRARISTRCATRPPSTIQAPTPSRGRSASTSSGIREGRDPGIHLPGEQPLDAPSVHGIREKVDRK